jgi:autoinducer 2 (AI-2) kinase
MKYLMAIDAGTGSVRAIIFNTNGEQISMHSKEWIHKSEKNVPNSMSFDYEKNWNLTVICIKKAIIKAKIHSKDILAVSASSMREGIVLYDKNHKELFAVANVDARASDEVKIINQDYANLENEFYKISGQTFALGAIPRLMWLKNNKPKTYQKVKYISMISDWILFKLSGILAVDPSNAGTSGIFNLKKRTWQKSMLKTLNLKTNILPKVLETTSVLGNINEDSALQTTLHIDTKVIMGGGDVQLGSAGLGVVKKNQVAILGGSFWQQIVNIDYKTKVPKNMNIRINPHVINKLNQAEGISFFSGLVMRWFRDSFCQLEQRQAKKKNIDVYTLLEQKASKVPVGSYGIIPIFSDTMKYKKWYHASPSFLNLGLDSSKYNTASLFRSLQENACIVSNINLLNIQKFSKIQIDEIIFASGASKGELWCQILADVTNKTVKVPQVNEATALGTAMAAGVGIGLYKDLESAADQLVTFTRTYTPNKQNVKKYAKIQKNWIKAYNEQLKLVDKGITDSMWKAPGL